MTLPEITKLIDDKMEKSDKKIVISFYELKVKENLSEYELRNTLNLISIRLANLGYKVYATGEEYEYEGIKHQVERNELLVGIK